jgi:hypothetical protein
MRLPTRFHKLVTALGVPAISLSRDAPATRLCEVVVLLVLSYQLRVLRYPERYAALGSRLRSSKAVPSLSKVRIF